MIFDWTSGPLAEGLECYRSGRFWHAHEHWEVVWNECEEPEKTFVQALIQVTAAFHHFQRNELLGTVSLLRKALGRLEAYPEEFGGVAVGALRESIREWVRALEADTHPGFPVPSIV
jgi:uncharacterized protein